MAPTSSSPKRAPAGSRSRSTATKSSRSTSGSSKKRSAKTRSGKKTQPTSDPARPIDPVIRKRAEALVEQYRIVIKPDPEVVYFGQGWELPGAMGEGETPDACVADVRAAMTLMLVSMFEKGETPPPPASASEQKRTEQINIRLTAEEKIRLEAAAARDGFKSLSDFVRAAALASAGYA